MWWIIGVAAVLSPIGLLASGDAWGEWGSDELLDWLRKYHLKAVLPQSFTRKQEYHAAFNDYTIPGLDSGWQAAIGYILCAITAILVFVIVTRVISALINRGKSAEAVMAGSSNSIGDAGMAGAAAAGSALAAETNDAPAEATDAPAVSWRQGTWHPEPLTMLRRTMSVEQSTETNAAALPDWLARSEEYVPGSVKSSGLLRSEKTIEKLLARLQNGSGTSTKHALHPVTYLVSFVFALFALSYTSLTYVVWAIGIAEAVVLVQLDGATLAKILKRSFWLLLVDALVYVPSVFLGAFNWLFLVKMFLILVGSVTYATSTSVFDFITALKQLHMPNFFIFQFDVFVKHLHVLGAQLLQMLHAVDCRTVGDSRSQRKLWSVIVGNLYLQMVELGKQLYDALEARAFAGTYTYMVHKMKSVDFALIAGEVLALAGVIALQTR
ncbi:MAG: hypothetical protein IKS62_00755 [Aeriscardovia sp.]|nr:hypothetical protein [Aeriscardovia sp.]